MRLFLEEIKRRFWRKNLKDLEKDIFPSLVENFLWTPSKGRKLFLRVTFKNHYGKDKNFLFEALMTSLKRGQNPKVPYHPAL